MLSIKNFSWFYGLCIIIPIVSVVFAARYSSEQPSIKIIKNNKDILSTQLYKNCKKFLLNSEVTAYCPEKCCNSKVIYKNGRYRFIDWSDQVAVGNMSISELHKSGIDIAAVDPKVIPHGSMISYNNKYYIAVDTGGAIKGNCIDLSMKTHEATVIFGRRHNQKVEIYEPRDPKAVIKYVREILKNRRSITGLSNNL